MRLPFQRPRKESAAAEPAAEAVQSARVQARRRLVGALVLLLAGVIGFPILFETQPRPLPVDTPIITAPRVGAATAPAGPGTAGAGSPAVPPPRMPPPPLPAVAEVAQPAPPATPSEAPARVASAPGVAPAGTSPAASAQPPRAGTATVVAAPASAPVLRGAASAPTARATRPAPAASATAGKAPAAADAADAAAGRFVIQVGAYTDLATLRETRQKVEKLGLKTYTQSIENDPSKRVRVRVGPFATRAEAQAAMARLKAAGLPGNLLAL